MTQHLDFMADCARRAEDHQALVGRNENDHVPYDRTSVVILKILTIVASIFLMLIAATSLDFQLAFIAMTMIIMGSGTIIIASEKIVRIFPQSVFRGRDPVYYMAPATPTYPSGGFTRYFPAWRSTPSAQPPSPPRSSSSGWWNSHTPVGGGHVPGGPTVHGTPGNVAVGGGHDPRTTTPSGNVIPGSGRNRK